MYILGIQETNHTDASGISLHLVFCTILLAGHGGGGVSALAFTCMTTAGVGGNVGNVIWVLAQDLLVMLKEDL